MLRIGAEDFNFIKPSSAECCSGQVWRGLLRRGHIETWSDQRRLRQLSKILVENVSAQKGSTVNISNGQAVFGDGGGFQAVSEDGAGFDVEEGLKISNGSTLIILNATAGRFGGGFYAGNKVAISNSTVTIQYAAAAVKGGGFYAQGDVTFADASTFAMSDTSAGDGGGFWVHTVLTIDNGSMRVANSTAERTGTAGRVDGMVSLSSQSSLDIHQAKGDRNSSALVASCLQLHSDSNFVLEGIIGGHGVDLQNNGCSSLCTNMTFQVATGAALHATGGLSSGLLSVKTCSSEVVRLSGIHLQSWNSSLLTTRPSYVVVDNVSIHFEPVDKLQILAAQDLYSSVRNALTEETRGRQQGSNGLTPRCECRDYQIFGINRRYDGKRHFYFQDDICHPCEFYRAWSDGERGMCQRLPRERQERAVLFTGAAAMVILAFIVFEILEAPLVILDARSDLEDPSEVTTKRMFTVVVQGPITSLPKSISRLVHQRVRYRAKGTGLQWLDFDPQKPQAIKVCGMARKKLLLQDVQVPFDCASCRGSLRATETYYLFTMLFALVFLLAMLPTSIKVAVMPLTQSKGVSFVTLWGGRQVDYFVSHSWDTSFSHFVHSIRCHALSKEGPTSWIDAAYWICSFANNQWNIAAELADDPMDSAFAQALRGGIKGVAMVLDHEVRPLTRVWCLFEFLLSSREQLELVFTTDVGVLGNDVHYNTQLAIACEGFGVVPALQKLFQR
ncbi:Putative outer membrane protein PmpB [Durusdinium trenchii]|uniref:Outer membrane protein PmpB n=1 Tax=Durusdinium trenchii TaxID=1381693 RepID=A0ABP0J2U4_9DINO